MVWGAMTETDVGNLVFIDGKFDKAQYLDILKNNLHFSAEKVGLGHDFVFVQDSDPKHTSLLVREWLLYNLKHTIPRRPQSPDIIPMGHLLAFVEKQLREKNISSIGTALIDVWANIPSDITEKLATSI